MKVLFVGFSVTAAKPSYYYLLKEMELKGELDFTVDFIALGGVHVHELAYFFEGLVKQKQADHIVFELLTSGFRKVGNTQPERYYEEPLISIINQACKMTTSLSFLNLPRRDVDYEHDAMFQSFQTVAKQFGIPIYDVNSHYRDIFHGENVEEYIWDVVHTTKKGAELYASYIIDKIDFTSSMTSLPAEVKSFYSLECNKKTEFAFMGKGYQMNFQLLTPQRSLSYPFESKVNIDSIAFITGPNSSRVKIIINEDEEIFVNAYDQHSYYERVFVCPVNKKNVHSFSIFVEEEVPSISLLKGEWDSSSRFVKFLSVLCSSNN